MTCTYNPHLAVRAAQRRVRGKSGPVLVRQIDIDDTATAVDDVEDNSDDRLGAGAWVRAWLFVSESEILDAEDDTP